LNCSPESAIAGPFEGGVPCVEKGKVGGVASMIGASLRRLIGGRSEAQEPPPAPAFPVPETAANEPGDPIAPLAPPPPKPGSSHEVGQLMTAISEQSNELQAEFAKISNWSVQLDLLMTRTATMQQILPKFIQTSQDQAAQIEELSSVCTRQEREIAGLQSEIGHYRPLAMRYEEELHRSRAALDHSQAALAALEAEHAKLQSEVNALMQRLSRADSRIQRLSEERQVVDQKLLEKSAAAQNLAREVAMLRSDLVAATGENSRLQRDIAALAEKMSGERESANEAAGQAQTRIATALQTIKELEAQAAAAAERERRLVEDLGQRDKTVYDLEIKLSALQSKADFLTGVNQQLRTDLRHHIDHVGTLEHSNRQLIEAMSRHRLATGAEEAEDGEPPARRAAGE
jgi:chromosome segregation ATPase